MADKQEYIGKFITIDVETGWCEPMVDIDGSYYDWITYDKDYPSQIVEETERYFVVELCTADENDGRRMEVTKSRVYYQLGR